MKDGGSTEASDEWVGRRLSDRYLVERPLGRGAMGSVYLALHEALNKRVAIKILNADMTGRDEVRERFRREAQAAAIIEHPNVCAATDFAITGDGSFYLVMEYLEGRTLAALIASGPVEAQRALDIVQQICAGLSRAHRLGIVHRDLKPDNVMLVRRAQDPDFVKLLDFGIAHVTDDSWGQEPRLTQEGKVYGTPRYISPEQACGDVVDLRADLYSVGVILFEMLAGRPPFTSERPLELLRMHMIAPPPSLSGLGVAVPPRLEQIVMRLLSKAPEARIGSAAVLREELLAVGAALPASPQTIGRTTLPPAEEAAQQPTMTLDAESGARRRRADLESAPTIAGTAERDRGAGELDALRPDVVRLIPPELARRHRVLAVERRGPALRVAMVQPSDRGAIADLEFLTGFRVEPTAVTGEALDRALDRYFG